MKKISIMLFVGALSLKAFCPPLPNTHKLPTDIEIEVSKIMYAIKYKESRGNYYARGLSGEIGAYQFQRATWNAWSISVLGYVADMTPENQDRIAYNKIYQWYLRGYTTQEIASVWNSGNRVYKGKKGINKYGVLYDTEKYVEDIQRLLTKLNYIHLNF